MLWECACDGTERHVRHMGGGHVEAFACPTDSVLLAMALEHYLGEEKAEILIGGWCGEYRRIAIVENLFVDVRARGKGIGKRLVADFLETTDAELVALYADLSARQNPGFCLVSFYENLGFAIECREDAGALMTLDLTVA